MKKTLIEEVHGACVIEGDRFPDDRGWFQEIYSTARSYPHLSGLERQINISHSKQGVVRGMHIVPFAKLCTCIHGCVYDVVVDMRENSSTYLKWFGVWLNEENKKQLFVPAGCAHGFFSQTNDTIFLYLQDRTYNTNLERQLNWRDPKIGIVWPDSKEYILSEKDKHAPMME